MKRVFYNVRAMMLFGMVFCFSVCSAGCGMQQKEQAEEKRQIAPGAAVYVEEEMDSETLQRQLGVLAKNAHKWRMAGDEDIMKEDGDVGVCYAVTDLDHNGRLEIMVLRYDWEVDAGYGGYGLRRCFELNSSGDGLTEIDTKQVQTLCLGDGEEAAIEKLGIAYYDAVKGEYHYVMEGEYACYSDDDEYEWEEYENVMALTLKDGQISKKILAYQTTQKTGKKESSYFRADAKGDTKITAEEYSPEKVGAAVYSGCGKFDVWFSVLKFGHSMEEMSEKQVYHALEKAYGKCFQGYPLEKQEMKIQGWQLVIPQYCSIPDAQKQKRINRLISEQVEQSLCNAYGDMQDSDFDLPYADISIKYATKSRVSLLLEARGCREGAASANEHCDTINIDLEQERLLSGQELLPERYRDEVEDDILWEAGDELSRGDTCLEGREALFPTQRAEGWQDVKLYQTREDLGVVIPLKYGLDAYVIYEPWRYWEECEGIAYFDVDWEAYEYQLVEAEYQNLQDYMPVLSGKKDFVWIKTDWSGEEETTERRSMKMRDWIQEYKEELGYGEGDLPDAEIALAAISICDLAQDGSAEVILEFAGPGGLYLILHKEGDTCYGTVRGSRGMQDLRKNGVYSAGKGGLYLFQMRFEKDSFVEHYIGGYHCASADSEEMLYYIGDKEVGKAAYKKWEKSNVGKAIAWYAPEALQE